MDVEGTGRRRARRGRGWVALAALVAAIGTIAGLVVLVRGGTAGRAARFVGLAAGELEVHDTRWVSPWGTVLGSAEHGFLGVPENRSRPEPPTISIAWTRMRSKAAEPASPLFVLAGGPGSSATLLVSSGYFYPLRRLAGLGDVVLVDQRGAGRSRPNLRCRDTLGLSTDVSTGIEENALARIRKQIGRCLDRLRGEGIDVAAYQSAEAADDLDALRAALGYERISILGFSYGTELANVYARRHPGRVERLVLLGPTAPDLALKLPSGAMSEFEGLARVAAADHRLASRMPDLVATMREVHRRLRAEPRVVRVPLMDAVDEGDPPPVRGIFKTISFFRDSWVMTMGEFHLQLILQSELGESGFLGDLPALYAQMAAGEFVPIGNRLRNFRRRDLPNAVLVTTNCATGFTPERLARARAESAGAILGHDALSFARDDASCAGWGLPRTHPELLEPAEVDRPVLMVVGDLDGRTPLDGVRELERRYPDHRTIVLRNGGHNSLMTGAVLDGIASFLSGDEPPVLETETWFELEPPVPYVHEGVDDLAAAFERSAAEGESLLRARLAEQAASDDYLYDFEERTLNALGYDLLRGDHTEAALAVFRANVELHPLAWNPWDSLGEAQHDAGDDEASVASYRRSLELWPLNGNGWRALERIEARAAREREGTGEGAEDGGGGVSDAPASSSAPPPSSERSGPG